MNIRLDMEYDGRGFFGWQRQPGVPTVQAILEAELAAILSRKTTVYGASRTDAGVHAKGQVANFVAESSIPVERWDIVLNTRLPKSVRILSSAAVPDFFHAQKSATSKIYEYRLLNRRTASAFDPFVCFYPGRLDWARIADALPMFVGEKDFRSFQGAKSAVKSTVRNVVRFELEEQGNGYFRFVIEGSGFLKQMVRNIIGTLLEVGELRRLAEDIPNIFAAKSRIVAGRTAPPEGLCLLRVNYPSLDGGSC